MADPSEPLQPFEESLLLPDDDDWNSAEGGAFGDYDDVYDGDDDEACATAVPRAVARWKEWRPQGAPPTGRVGCAMAQVGDVLFVIGGYGALPATLVHSLDLGEVANVSATALRWRRLRTTPANSPRLPPLAGLTCTAVGETLWVFGTYSIDSIYRYSVLA